MTSLPEHHTPSPANSPDAPSAPNLFGIAATLASGVALMLTLIGAGVSYAAESMFGLPHAVVFDSALDLTDFSGYAIAQILNHSTSTLFERSLYAKLYGRGWPLIVLSTAASLLIAGLAWWWSRKPRNPARQRPRKVAPLNRSPAIELRNFALALAAFFPIMPLVGVLTMAAIGMLCALVAIAPMVGMVAGESYVREWVIEPDICMPLLTRDARMQLNSRTLSSTKGQKASTCVVILKDGHEIARGRVIFMSTKAASLFDPKTGSVQRVATDGCVVQVVAKLDDVPNVVSSPSLPTAAPISAGAVTPTTSPKSRTTVGRKPVDPNRPISAP